MAVKNAIAIPLAPSLCPVMRCLVFVNASLVFGETSVTNAKQDSTGLATMAVLVSEMLGVFDMLSNICLVTACGCIQSGSTSIECDQATGQCPCSATVTGTQCDTCLDGFFGIAVGCQGKYNCFTS